MRKAAIIITLAAGLLLLLSTLFLENSSAGVTAPIPHTRPTGQVAPPQDTEEVAASIRTALDRLPTVEGIAKNEYWDPIEEPAASEFAPTPGCTSQALLSSLLKAPKPKHLDCVWDSRDFNPRRAVISPGMRNQFRHAMQAFLDSAVELKVIADRLGRTEFRQLVASHSGGLPFVSYERWLSMARKHRPSLVEQAMTAEGVDQARVLKVPIVPSIAFDFDVDLLKEANGGWYACRMVDMKNAHHAYEAMAYSSLELVRAIIEFALQFGAITSTEAEQLRMQAVQTFDRMIS